jgi:hypothetical protein
MEEMVKETVHWSHSTEKGVIGWEEIDKQKLRISQSTLKQQDRKGEILIERECE